MPKVYSARAVLSALKRGGFEIISQKGSHIKLSKTTEEKVLTVIVPNHKEIALGTFNSLLRQAELSKEEFKKLL